MKLKRAPSNSKLVKKYPDRIKSVNPEVYTDPAFSGRPSESVQQWPPTAYPPGGHTPWNNGYPYDGRESDSPAVASLPQSDVGQGGMAMRVPHIRELSRIDELDETNPLYKGGPYEAVNRHVQSARSHPNLPHQAPSLENQQRTSNNSSRNDLRNRQAMEQYDSPYPPMNMALGLKPGDIIPHTTSTPPPRSQINKQPLQPSNADLQTPPRYLGTASNFSSFQSNPSTQSSNSLSTAESNVMVGPSLGRPPFPPSEASFKPRNTVEDLLKPPTAGMAQPGLTMDASSFQRGSTISFDSSEAYDGIDAGESRVKAQDVQVAVGDRSFAAMNPPNSNSHTNGLQPSPRSSNEGDPRLQNNPYINGPSAHHRYDQNQGFQVSSGQPLNSTPHSDGAGSTDGHTRSRPMSILTGSETSYRSNDRPPRSFYPRKIVMPMPLQQMPQHHRPPPNPRPESPPLQPPLPSDPQHTREAPRYQARSLPATRAQNIPMAEDGTRKVLRKRFSVLVSSNKRSSIPPDMPLTYDPDVGLSSNQPRSQPLRSASERRPAGKSSGKRLSKARGH